MNSLKNQAGASVTGVVLFIVFAGLLAKFALGVIPAYVGDYQLTKLVTSELKKANIAKMTDKQFLEKVGHQMSINGNYSTDVKEVITFTNKSPGNLSVKINYAEEYQYYGNTYVVNRFERTITAQDAASSAD